MPVDPVQAQTLILLMLIKHRVRGAQHHKQQREKKLFIAVGPLWHTAFPVTNNLLSGEIFPS